MSTIRHRLPLVIRWVVGLVFVYMGANKALHPVDFLKLVHQYNLTENYWLLNAIAAGLPWFEIFCGLLLLAGAAVRGTALTLVLLLVPFTAVVLQRALALQAARHIAFCAVKFDCGCGGGETFACHKLLENAVLIFSLAWLTWKGGREKRNV
ncbi:MAG TPA: MauE/DoxX family redox-associated membrane protein [Verrucomicrobiae bacterium]|nr:MauE/DoxX family redox-associated membrane protein [Verrucomicrobiae bacterium]